MKRSKDIFAEMQEGEEYVTAVMARDHFDQLSDYDRSQMDYTIRTHSQTFKDNQRWVAAQKAASKAKEAVRNIEFEIVTNHK